MVVAPTSPTPLTDGQITAGQASTLFGLFCERIRRSPEAIAYRSYDSGRRRWHDHSWAAIAHRVDRFRAALAREDFKPGERVAVLLPNGVDWVCFDVAAHAAGLVVVGLYTHENAATNAYILGNSDARLVLLDNSARWTALMSFGAQFPSLKSVWVCDSVVGQSVTEPKVAALPDVLAATSKVPTEHVTVPHDIAALIYTSGTTGRPKGGMLSHFALLWNAEGCREGGTAAHD